MSFKDIGLNDQMDLNFEKGDLMIEPSLFQNQKCLLLLEKGELKEDVTRGVGIMRFAESEQPDNLMRQIRLEFIADKMKIKSLNLNNGNLEIDADYES